MTVSAVVTAAGQNRRMREDLKKRNLPVTNKLLLEIKGKTILQHTLSKILTMDIEECLVVVGHYKEDIIPTIDEIKDSRIKLVVNDPVEVPLAKSLWNGVNAASNWLCLCLAGDQPTISTYNLNKMIKKVLNNESPHNIISILGRKSSGYLDSAEGLGMPFACSKKLLLNYLPAYNSNLNPMLRRMNKDGVQLYGFPAASKLELTNVNYYKDYEFILDNF